MKFSSLVNNNSNKHRASTLPTLPISIYECYGKPLESHRKPDFQSLHLHAFQAIKRKRSRVISLSKHFSEDDLDYQSQKKCPRRNDFKLTKFSYLTLFCSSDTTAAATQEAGPHIPPNVDPTAYNLIMLDVDDILPSTLTLLVLTTPVAEPV